MLYRNAWKMPSFSHVMYILWEINIIAGHVLKLCGRKDIHYLFVAWPMLPPTSEVKKALNACSNVVKGCSYSGNIGYTI